MNTDKVKIGIFASSQSIFNRIKVLTLDEDYIRLETKALEEAVPIAIEMERIGFEVIISRRGTANILRENLRIPVLSFPHKSLDILESLIKAAKISHIILLTTFRQTISGLSIVEDLLGIQLIQKIYTDKESMRREMLKAKGEGCEVAVGGIVTQQLALETGLEFVEIRTSDDDIAATIENAKSVAISAREENALARLYRSIIDATSDGVIAADKNGSINIINATAKKWLDTDPDDILGKEIIQVIPDCQVPQVLMTKLPICDRINKIGQDSFLFNYQPVVMHEKAIGVVLTFRNINQVMRSENVVRRSFSKGFVSKYTFDDLVYTSQAMFNTVNTARQYAKTDSTILIIGETGTGKEIIGHGIHHLSKRSRHPFVSVNCTAIPEQLLESELFGYEEGAFTGSKRGGKPGLFEIAHQGSIFLDEVDSIPHSVQLKLLRVLQEREVMRISGSRKIPVDVRIIAASGSDLTHAVRKGIFREDLFFRINILRIKIPSLRQREGDVPLLLDYFIGFFSKLHCLPPIKLPESYMKLLCHYSWPGNVRQLRNFAERLVMNFSIHNSIGVIEPLIRELEEYPIQKADTINPPNNFMPLKEQVKYEIETNEKSIILKALENVKFNKSNAAKNLGISRATLWRKMKQLGIEF